MSKTAKISARVLPARHERYQQAAAALKLDELSDFVRRACDELAEVTLEGTETGASSVRAAPRARSRGDDLGQVKPDPRRK